MIKIKYSKGFTLIELMITLSVVAILAAIAAPSFNQMIRDSKITTRANDLLAVIQVARSEAVKRGVQVTMMSRSGTAQVWDSGWDIFTDWNRNEAIGDVGNNCALEGTDCFLRRQDALVSNMTIRTGGTYSEWVSFSPTGEIRGNGGLNTDTFLICLPGSPNGKRVRVNTSGSSRVMNGEDECP